MALLSKQLIDADGLTPALAQAADCTIDCSDGRTYLEVANGAGAPINVTIATPGTDADGNAIADRVVAVTNGQSRKIRLNPAVYGPIATVTYSSTTTITHGAFKV